MLSEEQRLIVDAARAFAKDRLLPGAEAREKAGIIEPDIRRELGELGFLGMTVAPEWGGVGATYEAYSLALMEIAAGDGAVSTFVSVQNAPLGTILSVYGTEAQKKRHLRPLARGEVVGAFALTEPEAGSDASALRTRAVRNGPSYVVDGAKQFITSGSIADKVILFAVTDPGAGKRGISCFITSTDVPGYTVVKNEQKLGQRASDTSALVFENLEISEDDRIGDEGEGYAIALSSLEAGRIGIAAQSVGMAQAAFDCARDYAMERKAFGKPIFEHQAVAFRLAEMETELEAARQLTLAAARLKDAGQPCLREACMAKLFASEAVERICSDAIQTLGGYGYLSDYPVERIYRDARVCQIYEGTSDVQKIIITRQMAARAKS